jgi:hypothetical protein
MADWRRESAGAGIVKDEEQRQRVSEPNDVAMREPLGSANHQLATTRFGTLSRAKPSAGSRKVPVPGASRLSRPVLETLGMVAVTGDTRFYFFPAPTLLTARRGTDSLFILPFHGQLRHSRSSIRN